jgi:hypothetical protein
MLSQDGLASPGDLDYCPAGSADKASLIQVGNSPVWERSGRYESSPWKNENHRTASPIRDSANSFSSDEASPYTVRRGFAIVAEELVRRLGHVLDAVLHHAL